MDHEQKNDKSRFICLCNAISQQEIEDAMARGCDTLGKLFDATCAGVGACGGSCQPTLTKMLEAYKTTGKFLDNPRPPAETTRERALKRSKNRPG